MTDGCDVTQCSRAISIKRMACLIAQRLLAEDTLSTIPRPCLGVCGLLFLAIFFGGKLMRRIDKERRTQYGTPAGCLIATFVGIILLGLLASFLK